MNCKISEDFWADKHNKWTQDLYTVKSNIDAIEKSNINFIEQGEKFLKICLEVNDLYKYGDNPEKKQLLNYVLQNLTIEGENILFFIRDFDIIYTEFDI